MRLKTTAGVAEQNKHYQIKCQDPESAGTLECDDCESVPTLEATTTESRIPPPRCTPSSRAAPTNWKSTDEESVRAAVTDYEDDDNMVDSSYEEFLRILLSPLTGFSTRRKVSIVHVLEDNPLPEESRMCATRIWWLFTRMCTLFIPDSLLCCIGQHIEITEDMTAEAVEEAIDARNEAKQAWREKIAIFTLMILFCIGFIGMSGLVPQVLCNENTALMKVRFLKLLDKWHLRL